MTSRKSVRKEFDKPDGRDGFEVVSIRADQVEEGMYHIPMEGPGSPVGKGKTWRICNYVVYLGGSVRLGWGIDARWYHVDNSVWILRPLSQC